MGACGLLIQLSWGQLRPDYAKGLPAVCSGGTDVCRYWCLQVQHVISRTMRVKLFIKNSVTMVMCVTWVCFFYLVMHVYVNFSLNAGYCRTALLRAHVAEIDYCILALKWDYFLSILERYLCLLIDGCPTERVSKHYTAHWTELCS